MIRKECFTKEWIETVRDRFHYNDVNLIEKVIRAYLNDAEGNGFPRKMTTFDPWNTCQSNDTTRFRPNCGI
jgi:hypothetical protein